MIRARYPWRELRGYLMHPLLIQLASQWKWDTTEAVKVTVTSALHLAALVRVVLGGRGRFFSPP